MTKGFLIDLSICIGCRACQVACKRYHNLGPDDDDIKNTIGKTLVHQPDWTNPPDMDKDTWLLINFRETTDANGEFMWRFARTGCKHCIDPGCIEACPYDAITYDSTYGAVVTDAAKCVGCESCTIGKGMDERKEMGCPFGTPRYGIVEVNGVEDKKMAKCSFCLDRQKKGLDPACAATCPTGAIKFGERSALLTEAKSRISSGTRAGTTYIDHVYGETEAGGTAVLVISDVDFSKLGTEVFPTKATLDERLSWRATTPDKFECPDCDKEFNTQEELDKHREEEHDAEDDDGVADWTAPAAVAVVAGVVGLGALYGLHKRKEKIKQEEEEVKKKETPKKKKAKPKKKKAEEED